jgi:hypothetical protein
MLLEDLDVNHSVVNLEIRLRGIIELICREISAEHRIAEHTARESRHDSHIEEVDFGVSKL